MMTEAELKISELQSARKTIQELNGRLLRLGFVIQGKDLIIHDQLESIKNLRNQIVEQEAIIEEQTQQLFELRQEDW